MKEDDSDVAVLETLLSHQNEEYHTAVNDNADSVSSNGEMVQEDVSSNLGVAAADNDDDVIVLGNVRQYQHQRVKTLIEEVNEEYMFWHPHRDEEDLVDPAPVTHTDTAGSSNLIAVVTADAAADLYASDIAIIDPGMVPNEDDLWF